MIDTAVLVSGVEQASENFRNSADAAVISVRAHLGNTQHAVDQAANVILAGAALNRAVERLLKAIKENEAAQ